MIAGPARFPLHSVYQEADKWEALVSAKAVVFCLSWGFANEKQIRQKHLLCVSCRCRPFDARFTELKFSIQEKKKYVKFVNCMCGVVFVLFGGQAVYCNPQSLEFHKVLSSIIFVATDESRDL